MYRSSDCRIPTFVPEVIVALSPARLARGPGRGWSVEAVIASFLRTPGAPLTAHNAGAIAALARL